jgi:hypothetical protein
MIFVNLSPPAGRRNDASTINVLNLRRRVKSGSPLRTSLYAPKTKARAKHPRNFSGTRSLPYSVFPDIKAKAKRKTRASDANSTSDIPTSGLSASKVTNPPPVRENKTLHVTIPTPVMMNIHFLTAPDTLNFLDHPQNLTKTTIAAKISMI